MKTVRTTSKDVARFGTMSAEEIIALKKKEEELGRNLTGEEINTIKREVKDHE